jgi:rubrerythrin
MMESAGGEAGWAQVECQHVCGQLHWQQGGYGEVTAQECSLTLPVASNPGHITCRGQWRELCKGRRPLAHVELAADGDSSIGEHLAAMAYLEAASVIAFEQLAEQLAHFGAPSALIDRCMRAAADERRHARILTRFAREHGARVARPQPLFQPASVIEVALHNAVEGCVHESFAALVESLQAERAEDPRLRRAFAGIAQDELEHGELAWDVHAWLLGLLDPSDAELVEAVQRASLEQLPTRGRALALLPRSLGGIEAELGERLAGCFAAQLAGVETDLESRSAC